MRRNNNNPRFTNYLVSSRLLEKMSPLTIVDVGARSGIQSHFKRYGSSLEFIGFEPNESECERLNNKGTERSSGKYLPYCLGRANERREFYICPGSDSLYQPDMAFWSRFHDRTNLRTDKIVERETVSLGEALKSSNVSTFDFIKIDVEGAELEILVGGEEYLSSCLGAELEVRFGPWNGQPSFAEVDIFMRRHGFSLYELDCYRHSKLALPITWRKDKDGTPVPGPSTMGQIIWANAVYLRDVITAPIRGMKSEQIIKLISLMEIFSLNDCALELAIHHAEEVREATGLDREKVLSLLTPPFRRKIVSYDEYRYLTDVRGLSDFCIPRVTPLPFAVSVEDFAKGVAKRYLPPRILNVLARVRGILSKRTNR